MDVTDASAYLLGARLSEEIVIYRWCAQVGPRLCDQCVFGNSHLLLR